MGITDQYPAINPQLRSLVYLSATQRQQMLPITSVPIPGDDRKPQHDLPPPNPPYDTAQTPTEFDMWCGVDHLLYIPRDSCR